MKRFILNPPWVDSLLEDNWDELASVVGPGMLPFAVVGTASPRGRARRVTVAPGAELGCGHYGCVLATRTSGIVCKVTSDRSEAEFVEAAWRIFGRDYETGWPRGIVRYHKIVGLTPASGVHPLGRGNAPLWMLWRDEVDHIGNPPDAAGEALDTFRFWARQVYETLTESDEDLAAAVKLWRAGAAREDADAATDASRTMAWRRALASLHLSGAQRLAVCLEMASRAIDALDDLPTVQAALRTLLDHDMLLADVHRDNVGRSSGNAVGGARGWVITDPGHFVSLVPRRTARGTAL